MCREPGSTGVGMVGMVVCSRTYPPWYVTRFIRLLDQWDTVRTVELIAAVEDVLWSILSTDCSVKTPVFRLGGDTVPIRNCICHLCHIWYMTNIALLLLAINMPRACRLSTISFLSRFACSMQPIHSGKGVSWLLTCRVHSLSLLAGFMTGIWRLSSKDHGYRCQQSGVMILFGSYEKKVHWLWTICWAFIYVLC